MPEYIFDQFFGPTMIQIHSITKFYHYRLRMHVLSALFLFSMAIAAAYELPANLENIYKSHKVSTTC